MKLRLLTTALACACSFGLPAHSEPRSAPPALVPRDSGLTGITVTGEAEVSLTAVTALVRFAIEGKDEQPTKALHKQRALHDKARAAVSELTGFECRLDDSAPVLKRVIDQQQVFINGQMEAPDRGFSAAATVTARVGTLPDGPELLTAVAQVCDAGLKAGVTLFGPTINLYYNPSVPEVTPVVFLPAPEALAEARTRAMTGALADAHALAAELARIAGVELGDVEGIEIVKPLPEELTSAGENRVSFSVRVRFAIQ